MIRQERIIAKNGVIITVPYDDQNGIIIDMDGAFVVSNIIAILR